MSIDTTNTIQAFTQTLKDISPILKTIIHTIPGGMNAEILQSKLIVVLTLHQELLQNLEAEYEVKGTSLKDRLNRERLSQALYEAIACHMNSSLETNIEKLKECLLTTFNISKNNLARDIEPLVNEFGVDPVLSLKLSFLNSAAKFDNNVGNFTGESGNEEHLTWFSKFSIDLAKDLAFNWESDGKIENRQKLFIQSFAICSEIIIDNFNRAILTGMEDCIDQVDKNKQKHLYETIEEFDLGYAHCLKKDVGWIKRRMNRYLTSVLARYSPKLTSFEQVNNYNSIMITHLELVAQRVWVELHYYLIKYINDFTSNEYLNWKSSQGKNPLDFNEFIERFEKELNKTKNPFSKVKININEVESHSREHLANLWGLSSAVCRLKTKRI